jgi:hypothetical protein
MIVETVLLLIILDNLINNVALTTSLVFHGRQR